MLEATDTWLAAIVTRSRHTDLISRSHRHRTGTGCFLRQSVVSVTDAAALVCRGSRCEWVGGTWFTVASPHTVSDTRNKTVLGTTYLHCGCTEWQRRWTCGTGWFFQVPRCYLRWKIVIYKSCYSRAEKVSAATARSLKVTSFLRWSTTSSTSLP